MTVFLRVTPNAGRDAIEGIEHCDDGSAVLRIRVRAVPDRGEASAAVIALLAKALGVPKSSIGVVAGATARLKSVAIKGAGEELVERLAAIS